MLNYQKILTQLKQQAVKNLSLNSKLLDNHTAFVALPGARHHGLDYLADAIAAKSPCVIVDQDEQRQVASQQINVIRVPGLVAQLGSFAAAFYDHPSEKLAIHAVTGTNGKTSCSQFIAQALALLGERCAVVGTLGMGIWPRLTANTYTTPDAITLQSFLAECVRQKINHVSLEASSIALVAGRMQGCSIHTALFTNFTQDHLDYHQTMDAYAAAKRQLFHFPGIKAAMINVDDALGQEFFTDYAEQFPCWAISTQHKDLNTSHSVSVVFANFNQSGIHAKIQSPQGAEKLSSPLLGEFNLENLLLVLAWLLEYGLELSAAMKIIAQLQSPPGRMLALGGGHHPLVVVDYAHTPDALEKVLQTLRQHCYRQLWCIFGCGGNRDPSKRLLMGQIASRLADRVIVTTDNPRDEKPELIAQQVLPEPILGYSEIILDRAAAIASAIEQASPDDIILVAGKGHENYQEIKGERFDFDDVVWVKKYLKDADTPLPKTLF
jgi:UDP-N-acetylmuramoyl-L-alanyl-D-glutamate--2,6-diaminopimelate ligase